MYADQKQAYFYLDVLHKLIIYTTPYMELKRDNTLLGTYNSVYKAGDSVLLYWKYKNTDMTGDCTL